ncbi:hypothetical protein [Paenibacillus sp. MMS20-IR301]|uniref:hypothetical protein n=1 Tax=Paenibacillus sp. MMS20-IR301 TaxID=2895946 RepID=UPI0028F13D58|nr:hypothetical protein [Paenibacillus sp. MMS20-IR301]WNS41067.1 hypothetical protein LOS79_18670 [Paenibacillus sp. MMS20-IR301]
MKPLSVVLIFLILVIPLVLINDSREDLRVFNEDQYKRYSDDFQAAVDDAGDYLSRLEMQPVITAVHYGRERQLKLDQDVLSVFYSNLALKFGLENNQSELNNLKMHMPALVMFGYSGYTLVTLDDTASNGGEKELKPVSWPERPYCYKLQNGNLLYFTLDDNARVYDTGANTFYEGEYAELAAQTNLSPLSSLERFREIRQSTITALVEQDLATAINRHLELVKRMGLSIQFTLPRGLHEQSIQDVGMMAFIQGYPLPGGELLDAYSLGSGTVMRRKGLIGTRNAAGRRTAYGESCLPAGANVIESLFDPEEAARKGYFVEDCAVR